MSQDLLLYDEGSPLELAALAADAAARTHVLADYLEKIAGETRRRQAADIALFERYLGEAGIQIQGMTENLHLWQGVSDGLIKRIPPPPGRARSSCFGQVNVWSLHSLFAPLPPTTRSCA